MTRRVADMIDFFYQRNWFVHQGTVSYLLETSCQIHPALETSRHIRPTPLKHNLTGSPQFVVILSPHLVPSRHEVDDWFERVTNVLASYPHPLRECWTYLSLSKERDYYVKRWSIQGPTIGGADVNNTDPDWLVALIDTYTSPCYFTICDRWSVCLFPFIYVCACVYVCVSSPLLLVSLLLQDLSPCELIKSI